METLLTLENVKKNYSKKTILHKVNITINKNEIIAINGKNGSGKSTLLKLIAGLHSPTKGNVILEKSNVIIGFVLDSFPSDTPFSIEEYIYALGRINGLSKNTIEHQLQDQLKNLQLEPYRNQRIDTFSKGTKQKVNIMQAILNNPDILILDEPFDGLDGSTQQEVTQIMNMLHSSGVTIVFMSHDETRSQELATKIVTIDQGRLRESSQQQEGGDIIIGFSMASLSNRQQLLQRKDVTVLQDHANVSCIAVREDQGDEWLTWILQHDGHITEVSKTDGGAYPIV